MAGPDLLVFLAPVRLQHLELRVFGNARLNWKGGAAGQGLYKSCGQKPRGRIWRLLDGQRPKQLSDILHISTRGIQQHLAWLREFGLATRDAEGRYRRVEDLESLELAARLLQTSGKVEEMHRRHCEERKRRADSMREGKLRVVLD
jgi:hypothetical protein